MFLSRQLLSKSDVNWGNATAVTDPGDFHRDNGGTSVPSDKRETMIANYFDFDAWAVLGKDNPSAFEEQRKLLIDKFIADSPVHVRQRMLIVQWRVDVERERCHSPMEAAGRIYDMMWGSVAQAYDELQNLVTLLDPTSRCAKSSASLNSAKILPFRRQTGARD